VTSTSTSLDHSTSSDRRTFDVERSIDVEVDVDTIDEVVDRRRSRSIVEGGVDVGGDDVATRSSEERSDDATT
jgi:hypothetical protein